MSYAVIFEVLPDPEGSAKYLEIAANLKELLKDVDGFISIERLKSLDTDGKILSLSFWENEEAVKTWRNVMKHRQGQKAGHDKLFKGYRIRVARIDHEASQLKGKSQLAVIFETIIEPEYLESFLDGAGTTLDEMQNKDDFISVETFASLIEENKYISLSFWRDGAAAEAWCKGLPHQSSSRLSVGEVVRDYTKTERSEAPEDSNEFFGV